MHFISTEVVRDIAVVGETGVNTCSVDEVDCAVVSEVKGVVEGHGPWNG